MFLDILPIDSLNTKDAVATVSAFDKLFEHLLDASLVLGLKIIAAIIVFIVGSWIIKWIRKFIDRLILRRQIEKTVQSFLNSLVNIALKIVLFLILVNILGIQTTSFAAILAAAGLAIGMAMKDNLSNFAGGVMLLINKPFVIGNRIVVQGTDGVVQSIGILYTVLLSSDNVTIFIPNGPLSTGNITNYSAQKERRVDLTINIDYGANVDIVKNTILSVIKEDKLIKELPAPFVGVAAIGDKSISIAIRVWVESGDYGSVSVNLNENIYKSLSEKRVYKDSMLSIKIVKDSESV